MIPSRVKEWSVNHVLDYGYKISLLLVHGERKVWIIDEAENIENCAAERKYDVRESCIRDWRKKKKKITYREE